ncbi:MAG TPA: LLM class flavin-dependent oxidoreductase [Acidocella sp.]|jgi:FMN-dependent oxidoreductase (nitrilotriacetate monooxygenase family)|uniref:LLM class flavin-dependent oxidoreductase n=1 Tax=Acidocella sp. TaxID=50710 RepID=UPI002CE02CAE|nr:LLM class flavin-dependent oxidoreductase [Acidocella sp.]HVE22965.1 LLM class flavin-dependent oxidoreductase [Acidocella sp.]
MTKKSIRLNAFIMNTPVHLSPGLWRHPRDTSSRFTELSHWLDLARLWERGLFDGVFLADVLGPYDVYGNGPRAAISHGVQLPAHDPLLLVPAMAAVTTNLGFSVTVSLTYEPPFLLARRFSTLDHLTQGRVGWNIVTSYLDSAARALGLARQRAHDDRYEAAEDYMRAVYGLWEQSWADDAVRRDRVNGLYADPDKVRVIRHGGPEFSMQALHLAQPSPQRSPVLYQAGSSGAGQAFAARHAECVFVSGPTEAVIGPRVARLRAAAQAAGRADKDILVFALATAIIAPTRAEALRKLAEYKTYIDHVGALTLLSGWVGVDYSDYGMDQKIRYIENDAGRAALENFTKADPAREWTVREVAEHVAIGGMGPVFAGSAKDVADAMEDWMARTGVDGFNLAYAVLPETFTDIVDLLVPELQARGRYKMEYAPGTLREKLFGAGPYLADNHPARKR